MTKVLNKAELLGELELATEVVPLKNGSVIVSEIGAVAYIGLWTDPKNKAEDGSVINSKFTVSLVAACVVDQEGNRLFNDDDIEKLSSSARGPFSKIAAAAKRINGLSGEEVKNSEETKADDLLSVSASTLDTDTPTICSETSPQESSTSG